MVGDPARIAEELKLPPGVQICLDVIDGPDVGRTFRLGRGNVVIGRSTALVRQVEDKGNRRAADIALNDTDVAPQHALLEAFARDRIFIKDLERSSGVFVNGIRLAAFGRIRNGDRLTMGRTVLALRVEPSDG